MLPTMTIPAVMKRKSEMVALGLTFSLYTVKRPAQEAWVFRECSCEELPYCDASQAVHDLSIGFCCRFYSTL